MNKNTLIAGLVGLVLGASVVPDLGWLLGAVIGGLLGQLLHFGERLQRMETEIETLKLRRRGAEEDGLSKEALVAASPPAVIEADHQATPIFSAAASPREEWTQEETAAASQEASQPFGQTVFAKTLAHRLLGKVRRFFLEGNPIVRVGMVIMLFGLSFLVKYAASAGLFPVHLRLAIIAVIAIVLLIIGWRTREKNNGYGLVLQGGGIGALYLTVFAATKLYAIVPPGLAFVLMLLIVVLGVLLAVLQNTQILALMSMTGGFLAPILTSDGSGSHVLLFSFYLLLNLGLLGIAMFKAWRWINWLGFVFTFGVSSAWGVLTYEPQLFSSTQPFLLVFFLLYLSVSVLFSIKQVGKGIDGSLIFGLPIVGFGLQAALLGHTAYGLAISALILALAYLLLAGALWKRYAATQRMLVEAFIALGVGFATIAIPLALDADWTSAAWALEAAGLIWVGLRQQRLLPRIAGYGLYVAAVVSIFINGPFDTGYTAIITGDFIGFAILSFSALLIAYLLFKYDSMATHFELRLQWLPISSGLLWWLVGGFSDIEAHVYPAYYLASFVTFSSASLGVLLVVASRLQWSALARAAYCLLPLVTLIILPFLLIWLIDREGWHPTANFGLVACLLFGLVQYAFLWRQGRSGKQSLLRAWHVITAWLWMVLLFWEAGYWQDRLGLGATSSVLLWFACFAAPIIVLLAVVHGSRWPFSAYRDIYKGFVSVPPLILLLFWFLLACEYSGATLYLHLPALNPLDLMQLAAIVVLAYAVRNQFAGLHQLEFRLRYAALAVLAFVWINVVVMRAVHHHSLVPYEFFALWNFATLQMALSIVWTLCALVIMLATRPLQSRVMWMAAGGLLVLVVIKLFTKDLTGSGTLPRVISFMAVGALMLLIGYLAPMPARRTTPQPGEAAS